MRYVHTAQGDQGHFEFRGASQAMPDRVHQHGLHLPAGLLVGETTS